jgi:hypothetical protein
MVEYTVSLTDSPEPADIEVVKQGLEAYDTSQGAVVDWVPLCLFARDETGVIIAGLTGSFNALPFYLKRGYTVFGELPDMPPGHTQYFMCKKL